jgi:hypothetical protein
MQGSLNQRPSAPPIKFPLILWSEPLKPQGADSEILGRIVILSLHGRTAASISAETRGKHANLMQKWFGVL